jgi:hypothetical protein
MQSFAETKTAVFLFGKVNALSTIGEVNAKGGAARQQCRHRPLLLAGPVDWR